MVVAASAAWEIDNAIAIFSATSDPPRLEWKFPTPREGEHTEYVFDTWDGEGGVLLRMNVSDKGEMAADLKRTPQGWQLRLWTGEFSPGVPAAPPQAGPQRPAGQPASTAVPSAAPGR